MLLRFSLSAAGAMLLASMGTAQTTSQQYLPAMGVKDAGTYHLATGTWTRGPVGAAAWNDVIYDNSCSVGFYGPHASTQRYVEDGRIPSTTSPENPGPPISAVSWTGTQDSYDVNMFQVAYCSFDPLPTYVYNFWDCFTGCQDSTQLTPIATFTIANMPGAIGSAGACWTVNLDLANTLGGVFTIQADCDGMCWTGTSSDTFGWSWQQVSASSGGTPGPLIKGDPKGYLNGGPGSSGCDYGAHTAFYNGADMLNTEGTGLSMLDQWEDDTMVPTPVYANCWWYGGYFSGNLFASFHMVVYAETGGNPVEPGFQYCPGDGSGTQCPFVNNNNGSASPGGGCDWGDLSFPEGGVLTATGDASYANADVMLVATSIENNFGIFFGANNQTNGGAGNPLNDGLRCAGGGLIRLTAPTMASNNMASHGPVETSDLSAGPGVTRRYQYWFRTPNGPGGTMANLTDRKSVV